MESNDCLFSSVHDVRVVMIDRIGVGTSHQNIYIIIQNAKKPTSMPAQGTSTVHDGLLAR
jgi:hypothetical protein